MNRKYELNQCAHAWAHAHAAFGHAGDLFFEGKTIYSYGKHFPIATIDGTNVFFTLQSYSRTTASHKEIALSAVSHKHKIYVKEVPVYGKPNTNTAFHKQNIDYWIKEMEALLEMLPGNPKKKSLLNEFYLHRSRLQTFMTALGIKESKRIQRLINDPDIDALSATLTAARSRAEKKRKSQLAASNRFFLAALARWENHEITEVEPVSSTSQLKNLAHLRLSQDKTCIETSKGIEVPIEEAERLYRLIRLVLPVGLEDYQVSIVGYRVEKITPEGLFAGCHFVPMAQIDKIAVHLSWV